MIRIETECVENVCDILSKCMVNNEEVYHCLKLIVNEISQDEFLMIQPELEYVVSCLSTAIQTYQKVQELFQGLKTVLQKLNETYIQTELSNKSQIQNIIEFVVAYTENFNAASLGVHKEYVDTMFETAMSDSLFELLKNKKLLFHKKI